MHVCTHVANDAKRQLEDVRGRCAAGRNAPLASMQQKTGFFLRTGDGNTECVITDGCARQVPCRYLTQDRSDTCLIQHLARNLLDVFGWMRRRQQLHCANTIPSDGFKKIESIAAARGKPVAYPVAYGDVIGKKVIEVVVDDVAPMALAIREQG